MSYLRKSWFIVCAALLAILLRAPLALAQDAQDNFIIIYSYSGPVIINSALEALYQDNRLFLPATYLSDDVEVPITYNAEQNALTGWLETPGNTVRVDFNKNIGHVGKNMFDFTPDDYLFYDDELYLDVELIDKILGTFSEFDFNDQSLKVTTAGNLPFDAELSRMQRQARFDQAAKEKEAARLLELNKDVYTQPDWLQLPFIDVSARYSLSKSKGNHTTDNFSYSANASFLTGGFDSEFNAYSSSVDDKPVLTLKTAREDETGHILGLFKHLEMGDTYGYSNAENTSNTSGVGIKMSTESPLSPDDKTYTFRDALPLGWSVELYRNGELLGYQNQTNNGYFEFADIPLLLGKNKFKLVFYGPQGQTKEKEEIIFFNGNILNRGKGRLRLNYIEKNRYLIETHDKPRSSTLGHNALIDAGYGLTDFLTLNVSAMADSLELYHDWPPQAAYREDKEYVAGNLSLFAYGIFSSIGTVVDLDKSAATLDYYAQTSLWDWDLTFEHIHYGNAVLARNIFRNTTMETETSFRVNKTLSLFSFINIPFSYSYHHFTVLNEPGTQTEHIVSASQSLPYNIYLNTQYQHSNYFSGPPNEQIMVTANRITGPWTLRGSTTYNFTYDRMYNTEFTAYRSIGDRVRVGARYAYQSHGLSAHNYESLYSANLSYLTKYGYISLEGGTSNWHNSYAFIGYNMSFVPDWVHGRMYATGSKVQGTGALSSFAYMDKNGNGTYDTGETRLPAADFVTKPRVNVYDSHKRTATGDVMLTHLPAYRDFDVDVDISEIDDTLSLLNTAGTRTIKLRPAQVMYLSFPIVATGDIEGTVYLQKSNGKREPFRGALVNLYKDGELVNNKVSEFDGYYSFPQVPLGTYQIRLDADQAAELEMQQQKEITIALEEVEQFEVRDMVLINSPAKQTVKKTASATKLSQKTTSNTSSTPRKDKQVTTPEPPVSLAEEPVTETTPKNSEEKLPTSVLEDVWAIESSETNMQEKSSAAPANKISKTKSAPSATQTTLWKKIKQKTHNYYSRYQQYKQRLFQKFKRK